MLSDTANIPTDPGSLNSHVPLKKRISRHYSADSNLGNIEEANSMSSPTQLSESTPNRLPGKKRWLKSATAEPPKKRVSLDAYRLRCCQSNPEGISEMEGSPLIEIRATGGVTGGQLAELTIDSLEERRRRLQEALETIEPVPVENNRKETRHRRNSHNKRRHKDKRHRKSSSSHSKESVKQMKSLDHFMKKQETRLRQREQEKAAQWRLSAAERPLKKSYVLPVLPVMEEPTLSQAVDHLKIMNQNIQRQLEALKCQNTKLVSQEESNLLAST